MHSCSGSGDSSPVSLSAKPEPLPRKRSLATSPDFRTISFMLAPLPPMIRLATLNLLSFSMPMKKRQVYFPSRRGDLLLEGSRP